MPEFLKGNYQIPNQNGQQGLETSAEEPQEEDLTAKLEEEALSILGGSMAFVMKGNTFIWNGGEGEEARPGSD